MDKKILLDKILSYLINDKSKELPDTLEDKISMWEELVTNLDSDFVDSEILSTEDKYLRVELLNRKLTDGEKLKTINELLDSEIKHSERIALWQGDITTMYADVLVNSMSTNVEDYGKKGSLTYQIFLRSGMRLRLKFREVMKDSKLEVTDYLVTRAYNLPSDYIVHVVLPDNDLDLLKKCYLNVLECARNNMAKTIVLPCLGTGSEKFSYEDSAKVAIEAVNEFLDKYEKEIDKVIFNVLDDDVFDLYSDMLTEKKES